MSKLWSKTEVEAIVADYFDMLHDELTGIPYSKASHRRALKQQLNNRSDAAIERKHQNISAILIELGFVYIQGYKPLGNYQELMRQIVSLRFDRDSEVKVTAIKQVSAIAEVPEVEDILSVMVAPPRPPASPKEQLRYDSMPRKTNFLELEARNRSLGEAGEEFAVRYDIARLTLAGKERLSGKVERVSETLGDGLGYDILSFEEDGRERLIEVKTTAFGPSTPFFVTRNELAVSLENHKLYHLYRAYGFRSNPKMFMKNGPIDSSFLLEPSQYQASIL